MARGVIEAIGALWKRSPTWRFSLGGLVVFSALTYLAGGFSTSSIPPFYTPQPPTPTGDPASDKRLNSLVAAFSNLANEQRPGYRCEQLASYEQVITTYDRNRVVVQMSPAAAAARTALTAADACAAQISDSDDRFDHLAISVARAETTHLPSAMGSAAKDFEAITGFDRSRDRYAVASAIIAKGKAIRDQVLNTNKKTIPDDLRQPFSFGEDKSLQGADQKTPRTQSEIVPRPAGGLTLANLGTIPIAVSPVVSSDQNERFARSLKEKLKNQFSFVEASRAALVIGVDVTGFDAPRDGTDGPYAMTFITAHIDVDAKGAADHAVLFATTINPTGKSRSSGDPKADALVNGVAQFAALLSDYARQHR